MFYHYANQSDEKLELEIMFLAEKKLNYRFFKITTRMKFV